MEAARIPWRPLGRILVEQGLLTSEELETALEQQERTGKRLGETIVECGFVSGPELSSALASQYGIELTTETGFGTGLRGQIQRRHETERRSLRPVLAEVAPLDDDSEPMTEPQADELDPAPPEAGLLIQLEEQWAKLAAAEALIAEHEQELAAVAAQHDRRRDQAVRLARRARSQSDRSEPSTDELHHLHDLSEHLREQAERLTGDLRGRDEEIGRLRHESGHAQDRLAAAEISVGEQEHQAGQLRGQVEQLIGDVQSREQELDRLRTEHSHDRDRLAGAEQALAERDRELDELGAALEQARQTIAAGEAEIAERDRRSEGFAADLERLVSERADAEAALAAAEASLVERDHSLDHVNDVLARRRAQAVRFLERLRRQQASVAEDHRVRDHLEHVTGELDRVRAELEHGAAEARGREEELERLRHELERASAADDQVGELRNQVAHLTGELDRVRAELERLHHELEQAHVALAAAQASLGERDDSLDAQASAAREALERRRLQAARFATRLRHLREVDETQLAQIEQLVANVRGCDEEIARLRYESERIGGELLAKRERARAQARRFLERLRRREHELAELATRRDEPAPIPEIASHLVFAQLPDRYELVERAGPPPPRDSALELPELDTRLVIAGARRSPLPGDARPCVVAEAAGSPLNGAAAPRL